MTTPTFERFDPAMAESFVKAGSLVTGLPAYLGIRTVDIGPGTMVAELEVREELLNPFGTLHGGTLAALVDHMLGAVLYPVMERGAWAATTEFKLNLLAPVRDGVLRAESRIVSMTKTTAVVSIEVTNGERVAGVALGTVMIKPPRPRTENR